jgi:DNA-binding MarR family transcriptional regulator
MDYQDLRTLQLLEEIERSSTPSQRDLAKKLNISLGLVNSFIKRLAQKGYFKVTTIPRNRVKYILTPKGAAEKTQLTYEYIQYSYRYFKEARKKLRQLFLSLDEMAVRRIVFCGTGDFAEIAFISLKDTSLKLVAMVDFQNKGDKFFGENVLSPEALLSLDFDRILITAVEQREQIFRAIVDAGLPEEKIVVLS